MNKILKGRIFPFIFCLLSVAFLALGMFVVSIKNDPLQSDNVSEAEISSNNNTEIEFSGTYRDQVAQIPVHTRLMNPQGPCDKSGAFVEGSWWGGPLDGAVSTDSAVYIYLEGNYLRMEYIFGGRNTYTTRKSEFCPSCYYPWESETYCVNTGGWINVSSYGNYKIEVLDCMGVLQETLTHKHGYRGQLNLNANGGSGGTASVNVTRDSIDFISVPSRTGYKFNGYYTSTSGGTKIFNSSGSSALYASSFPASITASTVTLYAQWTKQIGLTLQPNGGIIGGTSTSISVTNYSDVGMPLQLNSVSRSGYRFKGWGIANPSSGAYLTNIGRLDATHTDPFFKTGNIFEIYNNSSNGNVKHERVTKPADLQNTYNSHVLKISNIGLADPGLGGYHKLVQSYANAEFYTVIQAKIPIGYYLDWATNSIGTGGEIQWLTSNQGTGEWETYVSYTKCGASGNFHLTNLYFLAANAGYPSYGTTTNPIDWYVASSALYDATGMLLKPDSYVRNMSNLSTYVYGQLDQTLVALWELDTWDRYALVPTMNADGYYHISKPEQLAHFANLSKTQNVTAKIKLVNDIDLSAHAWRPIGSAQFSFKCSNIGDGSAVFDGQGYTITGLKSATVNSGYQALFGKVENKATIKNVTIHGKVTSSSDYCAGVVAYGNAIIDSCISYVNVGASNYYLSKAGIIGYAYGGTIVKNCVNNGEINGLYYSAGIVGKATNVEVVDCVNNGRIVIANGGYGGGIVNTGTDVVITNCINNGKIESTGYGGGIISSATNAVITNCVNNGVISLGYGACAGIAQSGKNITITNCTNNANLTGGSYSSSGGIIGSGSSEVNLNGCVNNGSVGGISQSIGGIVGNTTTGNLYLVNCHNAGMISGQSKVGGIVGHGNNNGKIYLNSCFNGGNVTSDGNFAGGFVGLVDGTQTEYKFENSGVKATITAGGSKVGGFVGADTTEGNSTIINNCFFNGSITTTAVVAIDSNYAFMGEGFVENWKANTTNTYVNVQFTNGSAPMVINKKYTAGNFSEFSFLHSINDGMPVPSGLFWIGGVGSEDIVAYLKSKSFTFI